MRRLTWVTLALGSLLSCDNRQAFVEPEWTWSRMLIQKRADAYGATPAFPDGMVMRTPPAGTVPYDDDSDAPPPPVTRELLELGRDRFNVTCAMCHGPTGTGETVIATKMVLRHPPNLHEDRYRALSREELFVIATNGYGLMPSYEDMLTHRERWAVAAYVQALQLSRQRASELPPHLREELAKEAP